MRLLFGISYILLCSVSWGQATTVAEVTVGDGKYKVQKLSGDHGIIWGLDFLSNDLMIFTEKTGNMYTLSISSLKVSVLKNPPKSMVHGQGGLLDVAVHPDFQKNKRVYVTYTKNINNQFTLAAAYAELNNGVFSEWKEFFVAVPANKKTQHFGSRLIFDGNGHIFFSIGDRGERENAQKLSTHTGKIIRLREDGSVPNDNPFVKHKDAKKEIWSYGHRNSQGLFYDPSSGTLYETEHGPQGGDEINIIKKGANYGWPVITYGKEYGSGSDIGQGTTQQGMEQPLKYFVPSIAPSGFVIYQGTKLADFSGFMISGALVLTHLNLVKKQKDGFCELRLLKDIGERIRDVIVGPDQLIYFSTDSGKILRLEASTVGKTPRSECPKVTEKIF